MFDEVLPVIRSHDFYVIDELLQNDVFLKRAITQLRSQRPQRLADNQAPLEAARCPATIWLSSRIRC